MVPLDSIEGLYCAYVVNTVLLAITLWSHGVQRRLNTCWLWSSQETVTSQWRGKRYLLTAVDPAFRKCMVTTWNVTHFWAYFIYGLAFPKHSWLVMYVGILFEAIEYIAANCQDLTDLVMNALGFLTGWICGKVLWYLSGLARRKHDISDK